MSEIYPIAVPKWGIEMVEGTINSWNKREGDSVTKGDEVFDMESDKIVNVWESPVNGVLRRIIATEGDAYPVGALLGVIAAADVSDADIDAFIAGFGGAGSAEKSPKPAASAAAGAAPNDAAARTNPVVRKLAEELGVDLGSVVGTGRNGRITQEDVQAAAAGAGGEGAADEVDIIPLSATRKTIARRLTEAKQAIPHFYLGVEYELDGLLERRRVLNEGGQSRVSVNDLIVWCVAQALVREPRVNVNLVGDDIHQFRQAHVSVAIATDDGLYPATIRNADALHCGANRRSDRRAGGKSHSRETDPGRYFRRFLHRVQPRDAGRKQLHRHYQPAHGRHPRPRQGRAENGGERRQAGGGHHDQRHPVLRSPHHRWRGRCAFPAGAG